MKIFIIGAGFTGMQLARTLVAERNGVVLIDNDPERVRHASDQLDCTVLEADGNSLETLEDAGIASADALVTLTDDDEINMITCSLVDAVYPNIRKIARVRNYSYYRAADAARSRQRSASPDARPLYGIDVMLNPDVEAADAISSAIEHGAVGNVIELSGGFGITTLDVGEGSPLAGVPLSQLQSVEGWRHLIAFVESGDSMSLPNGNTVLSVGDRIGIVSRLADTQSLVSFTRTPRWRIRRMVIFGADRIGTLILSKQTARNSGSLWQKLFGGSDSAPTREIAVVDRDAERCREVVERFPDVRTLCGDVTDEGLLAEEDVFASDLLVAASGNYELNLVTAAYLKSRGVRKTIALTANSAYGEIARKLGVDVAVPMRATVVDGVMSHLRGAHVQSVHSVCNRRFQIVEGDVAPRAEIVGRKLRDATGEGGFLVLLYRPRGAEGFELPGGDTVLEAGASVVMIAGADDAKSVGRFFN